MGAHRYARAEGDHQVPGSNDRRRIRRVPVVIPDAILGWWDESNFTTIPVRLINLSLNGCLAESSERPGRAVGQAVWLRSLSVAPTEWTQGVLVSIEKPLFKRCQIRFSFLVTFPYESFKGLAYGPNHWRDVLAGGEDEHEQDHFWK